MKKIRVNILMIGIGMTILSLFFACSSGTSTESNAAKSTPSEAAPPLEEFVGKFFLIDSIGLPYVEFFVEGDILYGKPAEDEKGELVFEKDDIFNVPEYKTKVRFLRNESGTVDKVEVYMRMSKFIAVRE